MAKPTEVLDLTQVDDEDDDLMEISSEAWGFRRHPVPTRNQAPPTAQASSARASVSQTRKNKELLPYTYKPRDPIAPTSDLQVRPASSISRPPQVNTRSAIPPQPRTKGPAPIIVTSSMPQEEHGPSSQIQLEMAQAAESREDINMRVGVHQDEKLRVMVAGSGSGPSMIPTRASVKRDSKQERRELEARQNQWRIQKQQETDDQAQQLQAQQQSRRALPTAPALVPQSQPPPLAAGPAGSQLPSSLSINDQRTVLNYERTVFLQQLKTTSGGQLPTNAEQLFQRWRAESVAGAMREAQHHVSPLQSAKQLASKAVESQASQSREDDGESSEDSVIETPKLNKWGARKSREPLPQAVRRSDNNIAFPDLPPSPMQTSQADTGRANTTTSAQSVAKTSVRAPSSGITAPLAIPVAQASQQAATRWPGSMGTERTGIEPEIEAHMRPAVDQRHRRTSSIASRDSLIVSPEPQRRGSFQNGVQAFVRSRRSASLIAGPVIATMETNSTSKERSRRNSGQSINGSRLNDVHVPGVSSTPALSTTPRPTLKHTSQPSTLIPMQAQAAKRTIPQTNQGIKRTVDGKAKVPTPKPVLSRPAQVVPPQTQVSPQTQVLPQTFTQPSQHSQSSYFSQGQGSRNRFYDREAHAAATRLSQHGASLVEDDDELVIANEQSATTSATPLRAMQVNFAPKNGVHDVMKDARIAELVSAFKSRNERWKSSVEEDDLVDLLRDYIGISWNQLLQYFPHRPSWPPLQNRYSVRTRARNGTLGSATKTRRRASLQNLDHHSPLAYQAVTQHNGYQADVSMAEDSDTGPVQRRPKRAAVEAASKKGYLINRDSFKMHLDGDETMTESYDTSFRPPSAMSRRAVEHPVTYITPNLTVEDHERRRLEKIRDLAALSGMLPKLIRPPRVETQKFPPRRLVHKRSSIDVIRPYGASYERKELDSTELIADRAWNGKILHVDFTDEEVKRIEPCISRVMLGSNPQPDKPLREFIVELMVGADESQIHSIAMGVLSSGVFINRSLSSVKNYLEDLARLRTTSRPLTKHISVFAEPEYPTISASLLRREGLQLKRHAKHPHAALKQTVLQSTLGPSYVFKKASSDVTNVCWSPDGTHFAAGATALMDASSMQYNRRNNLLVGDVSSGSLQELPNHAIRREATASGANASHAMNESQDPLLYTTISAVKFSPDGRTMFSAGYDRFARVWDVDNEGTQVPISRYELRHKAPVDLLEVNENGAFIATGSKQSVKCVKVLRYAPDLEPQELSVASYNSPKAAEASVYDLTPSVIRWGPQAMSQDRYLVAGFSSTSKDFGGQGETCVWDIEAETPLVAQRGGRCVFDIAWSPSTFGRLAVACTPHKHVNRGVQSVVRIFDSFRLNSAAGLKVGAQTAFELDSPALDVNDIIFNSGDSNLITTGCTDGRVYVWDLRSPDQLLHCFAHGKTLVELDPNQPTEALDTGIRFVSWDDSRRKLFSGSSDGVVALWDPYLSAEDAHVRNVIQLGSGVMSGAFSPDFSNLLLGEEDGTVTMLSVGHEDQTLATCGKFDFHEAGEDSFKNIYEALDITHESENRDVGITAARQKIDDEELKWAPLSGFPRGQVVQGANYQGPYDSSVDALNLRRQSAAFQRKMKANGAECSIEHNLPPLTEEEMGDNFAWKSRIPASVRWPIMSATTGSQQKVICFRCNTHIMQCNTSNDVLSCHDCRSAWRSDVLGYMPVDYHTNEPVKMLDEGELEEMAARMSLLAMKDDPLRVQNAQSWVNEKWGTHVTL